MTSRRRTGIATLVIAGAIVAAAGCSDDGGGRDAAADGPIAGMLRQLPASLSSDVAATIMYGDIERAADVADRPRPARDHRDTEDFIDWILPLTGLPREGVTDAVFVTLPNAVSPTRLNQIGEFDAELGWSAADVESFIEYQAPPQYFTVMTGDFDDDRIDAAIGERDDDIWRVGGDDFETRLAESSAARVLGESLRLALADDMLAVARSTPPVEEWLTNDTPTLADDEALSGIAAALDDADAYSAMLVVGGEQPQPLGIGLSVDDGEALATFAYVFDDEASADEGADQLRELLEDGTSIRNQRPWREMLSVERLQADGRIVTATTRLEDFLPGSVFQIVWARDNLATLQ